MAYMWKASVLLVLLLIEISVKSTSSQVAKSTLKTTTRYPRRPTTTRTTTRSGGTHTPTATPETTSTPTTQIYPTSQRLCNSRETFTWFSYVSTKPAASTTARATIRLPSLQECIDICLHEDNVQFCKSFSYDAPTLECKLFEFNRYGYGVNFVASATPSHYMEWQCEQYVLVQQRM